MKKIHSILILLFVAFFFSGCASNGLIPVTDSMVSESGDIIKTSGKYVADASVAKEHIVLDAHNLRTAARQKTYKDSGINVAWAMVDIGNGFKAYLPTKMSIREPITFSQQLPTEPSKHPMWTSLDKGINIIAKTTLGIVGLNGFFDMTKTGWSNASPSYGDNYSPVTDSYNQTAEPFFAPVESVLPITAIAP